MCGSKSVSYFAHDPAHRLLPAAGDGGEFTCGGCLVAGAGPRYRCGTPGCGFTIHEACALLFPRFLKSALHPQAPAAAAALQLRRRRRRRVRRVRRGREGRVLRLRGLRNRPAPAVRADAGHGARRRRRSPPGRPRGVAGLRVVVHGAGGVRGVRAACGRVDAARSSTRGASCRRRSSAAAVKGRGPWGRDVAAGCCTT
ncbi:unnamed protein product [Urochloa humidicola]